MTLMALVVGATVSSGAGADQILGTWTHSEDGKAGCTPDLLRCERSTWILTFYPKGHVELVRFLPDGLDRGMGEGFQTEFRYRLRSGRLVIKDVIVADPGSRLPAGPRSHSCGFRMAADWKSMSLADCSISGAWVLAAAPAKGP